MPDISQKLPKFVVLLGPTASGKTGWGIHLAKRFKGEVISADSRQVYTKMTIGIAKPKGAWKRVGKGKRYMADGIPHHLVDFLDPGKVFSVAEFREQTIRSVRSILRRRHIPLIVGGTGQYISAVVDNWMIPKITEHKELRKSLLEKDPADLLALLKTLDPIAYVRIDRNNPRRLIRALEVCILSGEPFSKQQKKGMPLFDVLQIGIQVPRELLYQRISDRVDWMVKAGLLNEVKALVKQKYGWHLPSMCSVAYRQFRGYLEGVETLEHALALLKRDTRRFARRQMTWFRRDPRIRWVESYEKAEGMVEEFLKNPPHTPPP